MLTATAVLREDRKGLSLLNATSDVLGPTATVVAERPGAIVLVELSSRAIRERMIAAAASACRLAITCTMDRVLAAGRTNVHIFEASSGSLLAHHVMPEPVSSLPNNAAAFNSDGRVAIVACPSLIFGLDALSGRELFRRELFGEEHRFCSVTPRPNSTICLVSSVDPEGEATDSFWVEWRNETAYHSRAALEHAPGDLPLGFSTDGRWLIVDRAGFGIVAWRHPFEGRPAAAISEDAALGDADDYIAGVTGAGLAWIDENTFVRLSGSGRLIAFTLDPFASLGPLRVEGGQFGMPLGVVGASTGRILIAYENELVVVAR